MSYVSPEVRLRTQAAANAALQADLGTTPFRWFNTQLDQKSLQPNQTCVRLTRVSTTRDSNLGGQSAVGNLSLLRFQIDVLDFDSETARLVANDVIEFMKSVSLCQASGAATQNPCFFVSQSQGMFTPPNPTPWYVRLEYKLFSYENLTT